MVWYCKLKFIFMLFARGVSIITFKLGMKFRSILGHQQMVRQAQTYRCRYTRWK